MSVKLNNNPTCVLTDADIYSESQKAKMAKNLMSGLPASTGEGDKVLVLDENGDPQLKDYSAGGGSDSDIVWVELFNATFNEIWDAAYAGKTVYGYGSGERPATEQSNSFSYFKLSVIEKNAFLSSDSFALFERVIPDGQQFTISTVKVDGDNQWSDNDTMGVFMPYYNRETDEGKVLKIVDGAPTWVTP